MRRAPSAREATLPLRDWSRLSVGEVAGVFAVSPITVMRDWTTAKAWLYRELTHGASDGPGTMETGR
jgi:DNA-directed RNA polymerase specialized sigma24 family protein